MLKTGNNAVNNGHAGHLTEKITQFRITERFGMHHQGVAALADQNLYRMALLFGLMVAVADQHMLAVLLGDCVHRFDQSAEKRVRHIHHHHAENITALAGQCLCIGIRPVIQLSYGLHHQITGL